MASIATLGQGLVNPLAASAATSAAPTAGTAVTSIAAPPAGKYRVCTFTRQTGTPDALGRNMVLRMGTTVIVTLDSYATPGSVDEIEVQCDGSGTINIVTGATNAGAGAVYNGCLIAVRLAA
jgi:Tfp pilus assembly ATPase PilU